MRSGTGASKSFIVSNNLIQGEDDKHRLDQQHSLFFLNLASHRVWERERHHISASLHLWCFDGVIICWNVCTELNASPLSGTSGHDPIAVCQLLCSAGLPGQGDRRLRLAIRASLICNAVSLYHYALLYVI